MEGCSYAYVHKKFGDNAVSRTKKIAAHYIDKGQLMEHEHFLMATGQGKFFLDGIAADFFEV
jgi:coproporphyrinogen III oxidase-like Fe-S oxidoreductase